MDPASDILPPPRIPAPPPPRPDDSAADWVGQAAHHRAGDTTDYADSWLSYPATYLLVAINVAVFAWMFRFGPVPGLLREHAWGHILVAPFDIITLIRFGASDPFFLLHGQWWRLLTATFVHVTVLHLLINMWCLWNLGLFGEPLLGKPGLVSVYVLTGLAGNLLSFAWSQFTRTDAIVAGASGAVFGIAGILIVLLSNRGLVKEGLPWEEIRSLRSQVILFAIANLAFGMAPHFFSVLPGATLHALHLDSGTLPRVDNTAHLGGFLAGLLLGLPLFSRMTAGKHAYRARQHVTFAVAALCLCLFGYGIAASAAPQPAPTPHLHPFPPTPGQH